MIRHAAAIVFALALNPTLVRAQDTVLTVDVPSADVHKGPSTVTPVIGHVPRGTVIPVSRNLGSWVRVAWPDGQDGAGFLHVTMGRIEPARADAPAASVPAQVATRPAAVAPANAAQTRTPVGDPIVPRSQPNVAPVSHIFGVGALVGTSSSFGATARAWRNNHLGIQFGFTRDAVSSDVAAGRVTSMQFEPGVVYALFDRANDYVWIRPYVGSVVSFRHETLSATGPVTLETTSEDGVGFRVFGGGEMTFGSMPRFGLSADLGYRRLPTPFPGFEASPLSASIAVHWYMK
jgi:hypothetical protein